MHLPTMQSMSDSHRNPSKPGRQMWGLPEPDSLLKQKWFGGQRSFASQLGTQMSGGWAAAVTSSGRHDCPGPHDDPPFTQSR